MEYVVNAAQRSATFLKFLVMFLVTVLCIISAVYFGVNITAKDNEQLREQLKNYQSRLDGQQQFVLRMAAVKSLVDSMENSGQVRPMMDIKIAGQLSGLQQNSVADSSVYTSVNNAYWNLLNEYNELSKKLVYLKDAAQRAERLQDQLTQCQKDARQAQQEFNAYRAQPAAN